MVGSLPRFLTNLAASTSRDLPKLFSTCRRQARLIYVLIGRCVRLCVSLVYSALADLHL